MWVNDWHLVLARLLRTSLKLTIFLYFFGRNLIDRYMNENRHACLTENARLIFGFFLVFWFSYNLPIGEY